MQRSHREVPLEFQVKTGKFNDQSLGLDAIMLKFPWATVKDHKQCNVFWQEGPTLMQLAIDSTKKKSIPKDALQNVLTLEQKKHRIKIAREI